MKKTILSILFCFLAFNNTMLNAQSIETIEVSNDDSSSQADSEKEKTYEYPHKEKKYPSAKRPKKPSSEQIRNAEEKNPEHTGSEYIEETNDTFKYGLTDEIANLIDELTKAEDPRFSDNIYDLFQVTKSPKIRQKTLAYFAKLEDPCLEDYAVEVINFSLALNIFLQSRLQRQFLA